MNAMRSSEAGGERRGFGELDAAMQSYVDEGKIVGMLYVIHKDEDTVHSAALGMMDREAGKPMQMDAIFRIFSMTKPITATAVMMLVEERRLSLDDPVARFLPAFAELEVLVDASDPGAGLEPLKVPITVRHLLTHTAGLGYGTIDTAPIEALYREAGPLGRPLPEMIEVLATLPLEYQPGTSWRYSISFDVLGRLIEVVSGSPFDLFLQERILVPLGMVDTGFVVPEASRERLTAHYSSPEAGDVRLLDAPATSWVLQEGRPPEGGHGLMSTASDYLRFLRMLLRSGELDGVRLLEPESVTAMSTNYLPDDLIPIQVPGIFPFIGMGQGLGVSVCVGQADWAGGANKGTFWWAGALGTAGWVDPRQKLIAVFLIQSGLYFEPLRTFLQQMYSSFGTVSSEELTSG
jgi:CubicO group peptidase (beta-lactamase class C family)